MTVLVTGATGFLGMEVLARALERDDDREIVALVRATDAEHARERLAAVLATLYDTPPAAARRLRAVAGDVQAEGLGVRARDLADVTEVLHCAASISFTLPLAEAIDINVHGTRRVLDLARELPRLRRVVHVSTAYVAGRHPGRFGEDDLDVGQRFRNSYEQSKYLTEVALRHEAADLPLVVARPSIVVGESDSGWTPAFNVVYWPLRAYDRGLLDRLPALPDGRLDVVPVDYVADALLELLDGDDRATVHLVSGDRALTNAELSVLAARALGRPEARFDSAVAVQMDGGDVYVPYFDVETTFEHRRGPAAPAPEAYFDALVAYAKRARWGKRTLTRQTARSHHEATTLRDRTASQTTSVLAG